MFEKKTIEMILVLSVEVMTSRNEAERKRLSHVTTWFLMRVNDSSITAEEELLEASEDVPR